MSDEKLKTQDLPVAVINAVVPNLFREAGVAVMLISLPVPGTENDPKGALHLSNGPMRYSVKGVEMDTVRGKEFAIQLLEYAAAAITGDLVAQLEKTAKGMADEAVPPPEGTDAK